MSTDPSCQSTRICCAVHLFAEAFDYITDTAQRTHYIGMSCASGNAYRDNLAKTAPRSQF
jgi:hypothetical protein